MKKTKKTALTAAILLAAANMTSCDFPWSADKNEEKTVYGPPDSVEVKDSSDADSNALSEFDPASEMPQLEYGPPDMFSDSDDFDASSEDPQDVYGPPVDSYDPEGDDVQTEYGAPEFLESDGDS